jgi:adenylate kinase
MELRVINFFVFLGPPGAGKGTQAKIVASRLGIPQISSGDIFRENLKNKTELGTNANQYIKVGELVPDDITIAMINERLSRTDCAFGAILDGFPRTPAQAQALADTLRESDCTIYKVPYIFVHDDELVERLTGRLTCRAQGHIFHKVHNPPKIVGVCDHDGSELYQREDDQPDTVMRRIRVYHEQTQPLVDYYRKRGLLVEVDGNKPIDQVTEELIDLLELVE